MPSNCKISYLISTYNSGHFLDRHIADLINNQTDPDFEIIIVDSDSPGTDGFIAQKWAAKENRIVYHKQPYRTPYGVSWLEAWKLAKAPFVINSNTDDFHYPRFTEAFYAVMSKMPTNIIFAYAGWEVRNADNQIMHRAYKPPYSRDTFKHTCTAGPQVCWRNDDEFKAKLDWNLMFSYAKQHTSAYDYWLWLYFMSLSYDGITIPEILTIYIQRPDSIENRQPARNTYESLASIAQFFPEALPKEFPEFSNFDNLPDKEGWIEKRVRSNK